MSDDSIEFKNLFKTLLAEDSLNQQDAFIPREMDYQILPQKALTITGVRRGGKTLFLKQIQDKLIEKNKNLSSQNFIYCNFSDERLSGIHSQHLQSLLDAHQELNPELPVQAPRYILLDEVQLVDHWEKFVDRLLRDPNKYVILTGSSAKLLSQDIATELRGRTLTLELMPCSFREFLLAKELSSRKKQKNLHMAKKSHPDSKWFYQDQSTLQARVKEYLFWGGFPEIIPLQKKWRQPILQEYFDVLLLRDLIERNRIRDPLLARRLFHLLISQTGCLFSISKNWQRLKSSGFKLEKMLVSRFLKWCEDCYALQALPLYSDSINQQQVNPKKIHAIDTGLTAVIRTNAAHFEDQLLETTVHHELRRSFKEIYYYHTRQSREIDFVVLRKRGRPGLIQVASSLQKEATRKRELTSMLEACRELNLKKGWLIVQEGKEHLVQSEGVKIHVLPLAQFLYFGANSWIQ